MISSSSSTSFTPPLYTSPLQRTQLESPPTSPSSPSLQHPLTLPQPQSLQKTSPLSPLKFPSLSPSPQQPCTPSQLLGKSCSTPSPPISPSSQLTIQSSLQSPLLSPPSPQQISTSPLPSGASISLLPAATSLVSLDILPASQCQVDEKGSPLLAVDQPENSSPHSLLPQNTKKRKKAIEKPPQPLKKVKRVQPPPPLHLPTTSCPKRDCNKNESLPLPSPSLPISLPSQEAFEESKQKFDCLSEYVCVFIYYFIFHLFFQVFPENPLKKEDLRPLLESPGTSESWLNCSVSVVNFSSFF